MNGIEGFSSLMKTVPESNIRWILENKRVLILKEELGTKPAFFYYFD